jgi:ABC-type sugar transport system ATPase subunit
MKLQTEKKKSHRIYEAHVVLQDLTKHFGAVVAVDHVDLTISEGEFFALLGPSGCGKTTTLRLIAGLEKPTEGKIFLGGKDVTNLAPRERDVAMVFQDYALYPHMTLRDNIGYPLKVRGVPRKQIYAKVEEVARHLKIEDLLNRRPSQVSGGQQQRAAVARALVHEPQVFLFDEPLSNLDAKLRLEARAFLKHLQREVGVTTIYVTHDQAEAMAMADRIAIMFTGRICQVGSPVEVYRHPLSKEVAAFIGNPPMNLIPGHITREEGGHFFIGPGFSISLGGIPGAQEGEVFLGIRPEHIRVLSEPHPQAIPGKLYAVQPLGPELLITVQVGEIPVSVRLFTDDLPQLEEDVWLLPALERVHLFGPTGKRLE